MKISEGLSLDDVLLVPQYSPLSSRSQVSLDVRFRTFLFSHPIIPANMKSIMTPALAIEQANSGGLAILHRFNPYPKAYYTAVMKSVFFPFTVGVSLGVHEADRELFKWYQDQGVLVYCIDVAHGDSRPAMDMTAWVRKQLRKDQALIAGNVATGLGAIRLWDVGADVVKVGVGPGSLCTTRIQTGCGVPQISALLDVAEQRSLYSGRADTWVISDGGIKHAGDVVKALALSDMVMCGRLFAGCDETGTTRYEGSSTYKTSHVEGVVATVDAQGPYRTVLNRVLEGVRSGCSYQGCGLVDQLQEAPHFVKITAAGLRESHPHDVQVVESE